MTLLRSGDRADARTSGAGATAPPSAGGAAAARRTALAMDGGERGAAELSRAPLTPLLKLVAAALELSLWLSVQPPLRLLLLPLLPWLRLRRLLLLVLLPLLLALLLPWEELTASSASTENPPRAEGRPAADAVSIASADVRIEWLLLLPKGARASADAERWLPPSDLRRMFWMLNLRRCIMDALCDRRLDAVAIMSRVCCGAEGREADKSPAACSAAPSRTLMATRLDASERCESAPLSTAC